MRVHSPLERESEDMQITPPLRGVGKTCKSLPP